MSVPFSVGALLLAATLFLGCTDATDDRPPHYDDDWPVYDASPPTPKPECAPREGPFAITALDVGGRHTCVVSAAQSVRCWGYFAATSYAGFGHVGDDETPACAGDVDVGDVSATIATGGSHSCALSPEGDVRCWGAAERGQLGYANTEFIGDDGFGESTTPAEAGVVDVGGRVVQLAAGGEHTCALLETGAVRCWGANQYGQLGYGNTTAIGDDEAPSAAGDIDLGGAAIQVAAGWRHTCAVLDTGSVRCWGWGQYGQLGYANTENIGDTESPASTGDVVVGAPVMSVTVGSWYSCALLVDGAVRCWGAAGNGELGYGNKQMIGDDESPATAGDVDVGGTVVQLDSGNYHTCALLSTGAVRCWGRSISGAHGQRGSNVGDQASPAYYGDLDVGGPAVFVKAGAENTCAVMDTGAVHCWGTGVQGRLGYGNCVASLGDDSCDIGRDQAPGAGGDVPVY